MYILSVDEHADMSRVCEITCTHSHSLIGALYGFESISSGYWTISKYNCSFEDYESLIYVNPMNARIHTYTLTSHSSTQ